MDTPEMTSSTFSYPKESYWKFKKIVTEKRISVKKACHLMLNQFIEDHQDYEQGSTIMRNLTECDKEECLEWEEFKRRMNLDGI